MADICGVFIELGIVGNTFMRYDWGHEAQLRWR